MSAGQQYQTVTAYLAEDGNVYATAEKAESATKLARLRKVMGVYAPSSTHIIRHAAQIRAILDGVAPPQDETL